MQDKYVGDIGDYIKAQLIRNDRELTAKQVKAINNVFVSIEGANKVHVSLRLSHFNHSPNN